MRKTNQIPNSTKIFKTKQEKYNIVVWHPQMQSEMNRMSKEVSISENSAFTFTLKNKMSELPLQENEDDFDFLSDYE